MTSDERKLQEILSKVLDRHQHEVSVSPAWLATEAMAALDPKRSAPQLVYRAAHLQLRQLARALCRKQYEDDAGEPVAQHSLFPGLQARYPIPRQAKDVDTEYLRLEALTCEQAMFNVVRLRDGARGLLKHADALEAWTQQRFAA